MISKCELYCYNGLFLDDETLEKLSVNKTDGIGILALLNSVNNVVEISNGKLNELSKEKFCSIVSLNDEYCYMIKNKSLIMLPITIYYGIKADNQVVAIYNNKNVRDVKYDEVLVKRVYAIIDDMKNSEKIVNMYNKQLMLKKKYDTSTLILTKLSGNDC